MKSKIARIVLACSLCLISALQTTYAHGRSASLMQVYYQACAHDPIYQEAKAVWLSSRETLPQNVANLLPAVSAVATTTGSKRRSTPATIFRFNTKQFTLTLTQPIINFANWARVQEANYQVKQAAANFLAAQQSLITRTSTAYFNVLLAKDTLRFTRAELRATARQLDQARQRYKVGLVAVTAVYEARAVYDQIRADMIAAKNNLENAREKLRELTGVYYPHLRPLRRHVPLRTPRPANKNTWVHAAITYNYAYHAAIFAARAAKTEIGAVFSGHVPTLNLVGTVDKTVQGRISAAVAPSDISTRSIALQLNIPLVSGGSVISQTRQAQSLYEQSLAREEQAYRAAVVGTRQSYNSITSGISKIRADRRSISSQRSSLSSTEAAYKVGTRTIVDVLKVQRDLYRAQEVHAQDQYSLINNILALKEFAGTLCVHDLEAINRWLRRR